MAAGRCVVRSLLARIRSSSAIHSTGILLQDPRSAQTRRRLLECGVVDGARWNLFARHQHSSAAVDGGENTVAAASESPVEAKEVDPFARDFGFSKIFAKKHLPELLKPEGQAKMAPLFARFRSFGVDDTRLKALAKDHTLLLRKYSGDPSSLDENLRFLAGHGLTETQIADAVKKHPAILLLGVASDLQPRVKFLSDQALSPSAVAAILSGCPAIMSTNTRDLTTRIAYLSRAGISRKFLSSCVVKHPALLSHDVDQKLRPVLKALSDRLPPQVVRNLVAIVPVVFARKPEMLDDLISALKYIGFQGEVDTWLQSMSWGIRFGPEAVRDKIDFLMSMDIHYRQVAVMLKAEPHIFQVDNAVLKEKLEFLFKAMKLDVEELLKCPSYLSKKSMDRVKIRWKVLSLLKARGIIQRIHLKDMVTLPRKWFVETFVFKYPDCGRVYYGERSALKQARAEARGERSKSYY